MLGGERAATQLQAKCTARVSCPGAKGLGFKVFIVWGLGFRVEGLGFRTFSLGFRSWFPKKAGNVMASKAQDTRILLNVGLLISAKSHMRVSQSFKA